MQQALFKCEMPRLKLKSLGSFLAIKRWQRTKIKKVIKHLRSSKLRWAHISAHSRIPVKGCRPVWSGPVRLYLLSSRISKCISVNPHNCTYKFPRRCISVNPRKSLVFKYEFPHWSIRVNPREQYFTGFYTYNKFYYPHNQHHESAP